MSERGARSQGSEIAYATARLNGSACSDIDADAKNGRGRYNRVWMYYRLPPVPRDPQSVDAPGPSWHVPDLLDRRDEEAFTREGAPLIQSPENRVSAKLAIRCAVVQKTADLDFHSRIRSMPDALSDDQAISSRTEDDQFFSHGRCCCNRWAHMINFAKGSIGARWTASS